MERIRILIADDHPIVRQGLLQVIERDAELEIVAEAADGPDALLKIREHLPQVTILDIDMPTLDGFQVASAIREENIDVEIVFLTVHREESFMKKSFHLGAKGYVLKDSAVTDIVSAVKAAHRGQAFISPAMTAYLIKSRSVGAKHGLESLTPSERNVLKLIAEYKTTREIADILFVSPRTIETHRLNICQKLHLQGSHSLMKFALKHLAAIQ